MLQRDRKSIDKTEADTKPNREEAQAAAREFWANQRLNQTDQPKPTPQRSVKMWHGHPAELRRMRHVPTAR